MERVISKNVYTTTITQAKCPRKQWLSRKTGYQLYLTLLRADLRFDHIQLSLFIISLFYYYYYSTFIARRTERLK